MNYPRNEDVDELRGKPMCELFSRGELRQWEWIIGIEACQGKDAINRNPSDDTTSKKAGDLMWL